MVHVGIKLQDKQWVFLPIFEPSLYMIVRRELKNSIKKGDISSEALKERRRVLCREVNTWRKTQICSVPLIEDLLAGTDVHVEHEDETLFLPSDFPSHQHASLGLGEMAEIEYQLREGEANDAVGSLCQSIIHSMVLLETKGKHSRGIYQNTRALKYINNVKDKKAIWASRYRAARLALLSLSGQKELDDFPTLKDEDMFAKNAAGAHGLGDGSKADSWIWTFGNLKGMKEEEKAEFVSESMFDHALKSFSHINFCPLLCSRESSVVPCLRQYATLD